MQPFRPADLAQLAKEAATEGWASAATDYARLRFAAQQLGWKPIEIRRRDGGVTDLAPTAPEHAHSASHSARTGTRAQPLHTDGAHLRHPPQWVLLHAETPNATATRLRRLTTAPLAKPPAASVPTAALGGLFLVNSGSERFLTELRTADAGWRWDPGCMTACDQRARKAAEFLSDLEDQSHAHAWNEPNQALLIDNRNSLHARGDATDDPDRRLTRLTYRQPQP